MVTLHIKVCIASKKTDPENKQKYTSTYSVEHMFQQGLKKTRKLGICHLQIGGELNDQCKRIVAPCIGQLRGKERQPPLQFGMMTAALTTGLRSQSWLIEEDVPVAETMSWHDRDMIIYELREKRDTTEGLRTISPIY
eukprot:6942019-Heterocapsa_arctica.AAC.1